MLNKFMPDITKLTYLTVETFQFFLTSLDFLKNLEIRNKRFVQKVSALKLKLYSYRKKWRINKTSSFSKIIPLEINTSIPALRKLYVVSIQ